MLCCAACKIRRQGERDACSVPALLAGVEQLPASYKAGYRGWGRSAAGRVRVGQRAKGWVGLAKSAHASGVGHGLWMGCITVVRYSPRAVVGGQTGCFAPATCTVLAGHCFRVFCPSSGHLYLHTGCSRDFRPFHASERPWTLPQRFRCVVSTGVWGAAGRSLRTPQHTCKSSTHSFRACPSFGHAFMKGQASPSLHPERCRHVSYRHVCYVLLQVTVCESHTIPGGAAHTWVRTN